MREDAPLHDSSLLTQQCTMLAAPCARELRQGAAAVSAANATGPRWRAMLVFTSPGYAACAVTRAARLGVVRPAREPRPKPESSA